MNSNQDAKVIRIPIVDSLRGKPDFMPMAIPKDLSKQLKAFHTQPFVWWVGHFLRYVLRPRPSTCSKIKGEIEKRFEIDPDNFAKIKPLVG